VTGAVGLPTDGAAEVPALVLDVVVDLELEEHAARATAATATATRAMRFTVYLSV
jgi:hypothetical protein